MGMGPATKRFLGYGIGILLIGTILGWDADEMKWFAMVGLGLQAVLFEGVLARLRVVAGKAPYPMRIMWSTNTLKTVGALTLLLYLLIGGVAMVSPASLASFVDSEQGVIQWMGTSSYVVVISLVFMVIYLRGRLLEGERGEAKLVDEATWFNYDKFYFNLTSIDPESLRANKLEWGEYRSQWWNRVDDMLASTIDLCRLSWKARWLKWRRQKTLRYVAWLKLPFAADDSTTPTGDGSEDGLRSLQVEHFSTVRLRPSHNPRCEQDFIDIADRPVPAFSADAFLTKSLPLMGQRDAKIRGLLKALMATEGKQDGSRTELRRDLNAQIQRVIACGNDSEGLSSILENGSLGGICFECECGLICDDTGNSPLVDSESVKMAPSECAALSCMSVVVTNRRRKLGVLQVTSNYKRAFSHGDLLRFSYMAQMFGVLLAIGMRFGFLESDPVGSYPQREQITLNDLNLVRRGFHGPLSEALDEPSGRGEG